MENRASTNLDHIPRGLVFSSLMLFFFGILLLLALRYKQDELTVFLSILFFMGICLRLWSRKSTRSLYYRVSIDKKKIFPGESVLFSVVVENKKFLPVLVKLRMFLPHSLTAGQDISIVEDSCVLWHQKISFQQELTPEKRGVYQTGSPRLITGDFFGFFPKATTEEQQVEIMVYPRLVPLKPISILQKIILGKPAVVSPVHDPIYVLGTRDYQNFSPARNIHWKASARHHKLQEKIFEPAENEKIMVVFEADGFIDNSDEEAFERAIEAIASLSILLDTQYYAVGFITNCLIKGAGPSNLSAGRGSTHISSLLEILAGIEFRSISPMDKMALRSSGFPPGSTCIYFSLGPMAPDNPLFRKRLPVVNIVSQTAPELLLTSIQGTIRQIGLDDIYKAN